MKILALDHVQLAIPAGGEPAARNFYIGILGLQEIAKPAQLVGRGGCWFSNGAVQIHVGVDAKFRPAQKAHPALLVEGMDEILARCERAELAIKPDASFGGLRRVHIFDPFGNRLELLEKTAT